MGLAILFAVVLTAAGWIGYQSKKLERRSHATPTLPALENSPGLARFRADMGYLPKEALVGFVEIPDGKFTMGSDPRADTNAFSNERWSPDSFQGEPSLPKFYIGRFEVTVAQFREFAASTGYPVRDEAVRAPAESPVTNVSLTDGLAYSRWLTATLKNSWLTPEPIATLLREGWQITLPDEAQWEKAARGTDGRIYPWGNVPNGERANYRSSSVLPVGAKKCTDCAFGLADMSGNVWELTRSAYLTYPFKANEPGDPHSDALFVMRGGSYTDAENTVRAATRGGIDPGARRDFIGFRVVLTRP